MDKIEKIRQEIERLKKQEKENEKAELMSDSWILGRQVMLEHFEHFLNTLSEKPCKSLDEAAEEYRRESFKKSVMPQIDGPVGEYGGDIKSAFIAGAEWQKGQMLKDAVEGRVFMSFAPGHNQMVMADVDLPTNTKVRIVVLKEEE